MPTLSTEEINSKVCDIVSEHFGVEKNKITSDSKLIDDLGADSLDSMELIARFEEVFDIEISEEDAIKILTINDVIDNIESQLKKK